MMRFHSERRPTRRSRVAVGLVLLSLAAGGCGSLVDAEQAQPVQSAAAAGGAGQATTSDTDAGAARRGDMAPPDPAADGNAATPSAAGASIPVPGSAAGGGGRPRTDSNGAGTPASASSAAPKAAATPGKGPDSGSATAAPGAGEGGGSPGPAVAGGAEQLPDSIAIKGPHSQGVSDTTIRVGVIAPVSGAVGFLGENEVDAIRAFFESVNAKGGIRGRRYQVVVVDSQFEPSIEATATKRLVERDKVFALISPFGDSTGPYVTGRGIPNIVFGVTPPAYSSKYPTTYPVGFNVIDAVAMEAYQLLQGLKLPIKSVGLVYGAQNAPYAPWADYLKPAWEAGGATVKSLDRFDLSDGDCTQLVIKMRNLNIDYWGLSQTVGWPICQQAMARQNYTPPQGRGGPYTPDEHFVGQAGLASKDIYAMMNGVQIRRNKGEPYPWSPDGKAPEVDNYIASMKRFSPSSSDIGSLENVWSQDFWVAAKLLHEALRRQTDAITWEGVNSWIQSQDNWVSGLISPLGFKPNCKKATPEWMFQWKVDNDGKTLIQSDWQPYGGPVKLPVEVKNAIVPGAGDCYLTKMADAKL